MSSAPPRRIVILISGRGGNMRALIDSSMGSNAPYTVAQVFSDQPHAGGLAIARELGVPAEARPLAKGGSAGGAPTANAPSGSASTGSGLAGGTSAGGALADGADRVAYDRELAAAIAAHSPALIVLAGFMRILSAAFVSEFAGRIVNIHPSLLPKFPGLHTHRRVLEAREARHGATVHFVTEQLDAGPGIIQGTLAVGASDDEASLAARVQTLEHQIYPLAVRWFCEGRLHFDAGRAWLDGRPLEQPVQFQAPP